MSDTPRTDQFLTVDGTLLTFMKCADVPDLENFCRTLERELTASKAKNKELVDALEEILEGTIPHKRDFLFTAYAKNKAISAIAKANGEA